MWIIDGLAYEVVPCLLQLLHFVLGNTVVGRSGDIV